MNRSLSSYAAVIRHGISFYKAVGWRRSVVVQGSGLLSSALYALGLASLLPVMESLGVGSGHNPSPGFLGKTIALVPLLSNHRLVSILLLLFTLTIFLLRSIFLGFYYGYGGRLTEEYTRNLRDGILTTYAQDREHYASENAKTKILYLNSQLLQLSAFNWGILFCTLQLYTLLVLIVVNIYLSPGIFAVSLSIGLAMIPLTQPILHKISNIGAALYHLNHRILTSANNFTEGFETLTTLNVRDGMQKGVWALGIAAMREQFALGGLQGVMAALPEILVSVVALGFFIILGSAAFNGPLIAISGYSMIRLVGAIGQINEKMGDLLKSRKIVDEVEGFLAKQAPRGDMSETQRTATVSPSASAIAIVGDNVTVSASNRPLVLGANFRLDRPAIYQLAGPNGSGKSTLLRALAGLLPYKGSLTIQAREVNTLTRESIASLISYHSQDNFLLAGTFLDNVLLGNPGATAKDVERLLIQMQLETHPLFAKGLDFSIAETASNLSGGERQLICVLRTFLRDTPVYLFDEYTNHLSVSVTGKLANYMRSLQGKIVVIVSHGNLQAADTLFAMEHGKIVEMVQRESNSAPVIATTGPSGM